MSIKKFFRMKDQAVAPSSSTGIEATVEAGQKEPLAICAPPWLIGFLFPVSCWATFIATVVVLPACAVRYHSSPEFGPTLVVFIFLVVMCILVLSLLYCVMRGIKISPVVPQGRDKWTSKEEDKVDSVMFTLRLIFLTIYLAASGAGFLVLWLYGAWHPAVYDRYKLVPFCPALFVAYISNYLFVPQLVRHFRPGNKMSAKYLRSLGSYTLLWATARTATENAPMALGNTSGAATALSRERARPRRSV